MNKLASTIRNRLDTLAEEYDWRLREMEGFVELPDQVRLDVARDGLNRIANCLEAGDDTEFIHFIQTRADEWATQDLELESLLQALTAFEETLQPLITTVEAATFLWRTLSQARTIVSRIATERVRASEERVKHSQNTLQTLLDSMSFGVVIIGKDKKVRRANNAALASMGYESEEQIVGMACHRTLCPTEAGKCPILDLGKELDRSERILVTKDRKHIPILKSVVPVTLDGEDVLLEAFVDITERKQAEEDLRESEARYRDLFENANDLIQSVAPNSSFLYVNRTWQETLGYSEEEISNLTVLDIIHPDSRAHCMEIFQSVMAGESIDRVEAIFVARDGRTIAVEGSVNCYFKDGVPVATRGIFRDITERKQAEEALLRLERAVEQSIDGIAVADMDGNIQFVNPAWAQMHGYSAEELLGRPLSIFHTEGQLQEDVIPFNERVMEIGFHWGEVGHVRKDGTTFPTWMTTTLLKDEKGNPFGLVGTARDITERKQLEREREDLSERRAEQVRTSTEVAQEIAIAPALDELFRRVVTLIKERFGYYHAQIFRYEPAVNAVVLVTGYGEAGEKMLAEGHRLEMGRGIVGAAATTGQPVLATDVTLDADWMPHPHLPETKCELAVPIILRQAQDGELRAQVLGILDVQSDSAGVLTQEDQLLLEGLCGQIAIAIESTRLRQEMEENLRELERLYRAMSREAWETFQRKVGPTGYLFDRTDVMTADDFWVPEIGLAMERQALVPPTRDGQPMAVMPLSVRGEIIGALGVQDDPQYPLSQDDLALVESVSEQVALALESARLFEQTQAALAQTEALYKGSDRVVRATALDDVLQALIHSTTLGRLDRVSIALFNRPWEDEMPEEAMIAATWERSGEESRTPVGTRYLLEQFPAIEAVTRAEPAIFRDITTDDRVYETLRALLLDRLGMRSLVLWPLVVGGQWIGFLNGQAATALEIDEDEIRQITSLTDQAVTVIQNIRLFEETQRRAVQLETAAQVSRAATSMLDTGQLLDETVNLIRDRFDLYHVGIFLLDKAGEYAVLQAGTGEAGQEMLKQNHKLKVGGTSMIGWCTAHSKARIALDVGKEAVRFDNPLLPGTRSEMALPLTSRGRVIGAMTIQSDQPAAFSEEDIAALQTMADQLANAIENTQLFQETKANLEEITLLHRRYLQETWGKFMQEETSQERAGYMYNQGTVSPASTAWRPEIGLAVQRGDTIALSDMAHALQGTVEEVGAILQASPAQSALAVPLKVRGQVIGALDFYETEQVRDWSVEDIAIVEAVANQVALAIENARAYEELQKKADQLKEIDRLKTQFLANMSHELRTPLNSIIGFSRVILKGIDGPITKQQRVDLTSIYNNGQHLLGMINDILDISKIEAGRMELLFEPVDMQQITSGVMSTAIALVKDRPIELKQEVAPDLPTIRADGTRVRQVVLNLLSNATKFTEEGHVILRAWADEEQITVSVEDTGIGIASEHQGLIFEEFRQVDGSTTRRTGGTGLGLAISRHFVEMHGGRIWVESEPGVGSTFTFTLPITGPAPVVHSELSDLTIDPSRKLILAVEDDEGAIAIYKRYLEKQGYQVVGLNQGEQAVRWALELSPRAIILDVLLPDKNGWAVLEELKSSREAHQIPVIICTILDDGEARGLSLGAADYLVKPILEEDLLQALHRLEERQWV